jgi:vitamin B12 transporter
MIMAAFLSGSFGYAQDTIHPKQLDEVIITANRYLQKSNTTGKLVTLIDRETILANSSRSIAEIIQANSTMFISGANATAGSNKEIYLLGADHGRVLILVDGIPVTDPSMINNTFDLNHLDASQIDHIEILQGAQSTLWGSDAVAGVINIISKPDHEQKQSANALISFGSNGTLKSSIQASGKMNKLHYLATLSYHRSNEYSSATDSSGHADFDHDGYHQANTQWRLSYPINEYFKVSACFNYSHYSAGLDAGAFADDRDYNTTNTNSMGGISLTYTRKHVQFFATQHYTHATRAFTDDSLSIGGFSKYSQGSYQGAAILSELYGVLQLNKLITLVSGIENHHQVTDQHYYSLSVFGPFETSLGDTATTDNLAAYGSVSINHKKYTMEGGIRANHHSIYGFNHTFTLNPSWLLLPHTRLSFNVSSAFKSPSLYQLYSEYGNKKLHPESSLHYELSIQSATATGNHTLRLTWFKRNARDLILFYSDPVTFESKYINRDRQFDHGVEMEYSMRLTKKMRWLTNISFVDGYGIEDHVRIANLYHRPKVVLNTVFRINPDGAFSVMPSIRYIGKRLKGLYDPGPEYIPSYMVLDCITHYKFNDHLTAFCDVRNIGNAVYYDIPGYNTSRINGMLGIKTIF